MGKGQRIRTARAAEKEAMRAITAKKEKKAKVKRIVTTIIAAVLILSIVGGVVYHAVYTAAYNKGTIQRNTVVLQSKNYTVDAAMMSFFFYSQYSNFVSNYSSYLSSFGLDTSIPLKQQDCMVQTGTSWFDYFSSMAGSQARELVYLAEKAVEKGMKLDDADQKSIQETIDTYYEAARSNNMSNVEFLHAAFGKGVNEGDVRKCLELSHMADKFQQSYVDSLKYTDEELEKYYNDNIDSYRYVDYYSYSVIAEDTKDETKYAAAEAKAKELAAVKDVDAFKAWVEKDYRNDNPLTEKFKEEDLKKALDTVMNGLYHELATYNEDDEASKWMFKTGKVGETYIHDDEKGTYTVYYLAATPHRDETATRTIRNIVLTTATGSKEEIKETADKILKEMKEAGLTEETFKKYALEYSEQTTTSADGGLCENYKESSYDGKIGKWTFNKDRKVGDIEVVEIDSGYAVCYYVGEGIPAWKADCTTAKKNADYDAAYEGWVAEITVTENLKGYKKIPDIG